MTDSPLPDDDRSHVTVRLPAQPSVDSAHRDTVSPPWEAIEMCCGSVLPLNNRYELKREIGRGGMGVVFRGVDRTLERDLAVKVLQESFRTDAQQIRRFQKEAWIIGQLQHPGIVPLYDAGQLADGRPYLVMKLIEGRTLAGLLASRRATTDDRARLLKVFEQICQTLAYAHNRGVIHCDLKPANIMVGEFGEVQVMDWGLARVVTDPPEVRFGAECDQLAEHRMDPSASRLKSRPLTDSISGGDIVGTPAYMSPEQARGEATLNERTDVFGLGAILCEMLTGKPPYSSSDANEALTQAALGIAGPFLRRLVECEAEPELIALTKACLAVDPVSRPATAGEVAAQIATHLASAAERAQRAEIERAAALARAWEERKRRRLAGALATAVLAIIAVIAIGAVGIAQQRQRRAEEQARFEQQRQQQRTQLVRRIEQALAQSERLALLAEQQPDALPTLATALATARQARALVGDELADPDLEARLNQKIIELEAAEAAARRDLGNRRMLARLEEIRLQQSELKDEAFDLASALPAYAVAFRDYGIDIDRLEPAESAQRIKDSRIRRELSVALLHWATIRRIVGKASDPMVLRLLDIAAQVDQDSWNREFLSAILNPDPETNRRLAASLDLDHSPAAVVHLFIAHLANMADLKSAIDLSQRAVLRFPSDFWLNHQCGDLMIEVRPPQLQEGIRYLTAAVALRPQSPGAHLNLGYALQLNGELELAVEHTREALRLQPDYAAAHCNLGSYLSRLGRFDEAIAVLRRAVELQPDGVTGRINLIDALVGAQRNDEAVELGRQTRTMFPSHPSVATSFVRALLNRRQVEEAEQVARDNAQRHPQRPEVHFYLGNVLSDQKRHEDAATSFREAIRLSPDYAEAMCNLGYSLRQLGRFEEGHEYTLRGHQLGSSRREWPFPSAAWVRESEQWLARDRRWKEIRSGQAKPSDASEALIMAHFSFGRKFDPGAALDFFADAFERNPSLTRGPVNPHRMRAIEAAAAIQPIAEESVRNRWRAEALVWLRADHDSWRERRREDEARVRAEVRDRLTAPALKHLREPDALATFPEAERAEWEKLWAELRELAQP